VIDRTPLHPLQPPAYGVFQIQAFAESCAIPIKVARILLEFLAVTGGRVHKETCESVFLLANSRASVIYLNIERNGRRGRD
jgi:hypothetical protein